ncbi:MAG: hypothetical protein ACRDGH_12150 [Candidatus Limnocylindria bacterium]
MTADTRPLRRRAEWAVLLLAGPVIWYLHFWGIYLLAEAGCVLGRSESSSPEAMWLTVAILAATTAAVGLIAWFSLRAWRRWRAPDGNSFHSPLAFIGFVLGLLFLLATLMVGLPAAVMHPC